MIDNGTLNTHAGALFINESVVKELRDCCDARKAAEEEKVAHGTESEK